MKENATQNQISSDVDFDNLTKALWNIRKKTGGDIMYLTEAINEVIDDIYGIIEICQTWINSTSNLNE